MTTTSAKKLTFDQWQALPETKQRCEVVDGVLLMPPGPTPEHQILSIDIVTQLSPFVRERELGVVITAPCDVLISREPLRVRQPDIFYLSAARAGVRRVSDLAGIQRIQSPPDLVVEILSPSNTRRQIQEKLADYRSIGVLECWLVNFPARTIEVLRLTPESATTIATYGIADTLQSQILPGFALPIANIFGPLLK